MCVCVCVCNRARDLKGLILELARNSHKTDRPTNYPKNYNILMFELTMCVHLCVQKCCWNIFLFSVCVHVWMRECLLCRQLEVVSCMQSRGDRCTFQLFVLVLQCSPSSNCKPHQEFRIQQNKFFCCYTFTRSERNVPAL